MPIQYLKTKIMNIIMALALLLLVFSEQKLPTNKQALVVAFSFLFSLSVYVISYKTKLRKFILYTHWVLLVCLSLFLIWELLHERYDIVPLFFMSPLFLANIYVISLLDKSNQIKNKSLEDDLSKEQKINVFVDYLGNELNDDTKGALSKTANFIGRIFPFISLGLAIGFAVLILINL